MSCDTFKKPHSPTRRSRSSSKSSRKPGPKKRGNDFICPKVYKNTLPDLPFASKFLPVRGLEPSRFIDFDFRFSNGSSIHQYDIHAPIDVGVHVDMIDREAYQINKPPAKLHPTDALLLRSEAGDGRVFRDRSELHKLSVPWMRKTEYISQESFSCFRKPGRMETKIGAGLKKKKYEVVSKSDLQSKINAINKTFEDVKKKVNRHYNKKDVYALQEIPLLPDFQNWKNAFSLMLFDSDPSPLCTENEEIKKLMMRHSHIRQDRGSEDVVNLFCPDIQTLAKILDDKVEDKRIAIDHQEIYIYPKVRDYNFTMVNDEQRGPEIKNYFFSFRSDGIFYNEIAKNVRLTKTRIPSKKEILAVKYTELSEKDRAKMEAKMASLMNVPCIKKEVPDLESHSIAGIASAATKLIANMALVKKEIKSNEDETENKEAGFAQAHQAKYDLALVKEEALSSTSSEYAD